VWRVDIIFTSHISQKLSTFCLHQKFTSFSLFQKFHNLPLCLQIICKSPGIINVQWSCSYLGMWAALEDLWLSVIWCNGYPFNKSGWLNHQIIPKYPLHPLLRLDLCTKSVSKYDCYLQFLHSDLVFFIAMGVLM
jgi:hypothetical protein